MNLAALLKIVMVDAAAHHAATSDLNLLPAPTSAQTHAGNYRKGHTRVGGLPIAIENPAGSRRRPEWPVLTAHYGYVKGTLGADGDHVDVFLRPGTPNDWRGTVYVIDQPAPDGSFDEHKCMIGWTDQADAVRAYRGNYESGWRVGPVTAMSAYDFGQWVRRGDTTKPLSETRSENRVAWPLREKIADRLKRKTSG